MAVSRSHLASSAARWAPFGSPPAVRAIWPASSVIRAVLSASEPSLAWKVTAASASRLVGEASSCGRRHRRRRHRRAAAGPRARCRPAPAADRLLSMLATATKRGIRLPSGPAHREIPLVVLHASRSALRAAARGNAARSGRRAAPAIPSARSPRRARAGSMTAVPPSASAAATTPARMRSRRASKSART